MAGQAFTISRLTVSPYVVIDEADLTSPEMNAAMAEMRDAFARRHAEAVAHAMFGGHRTIEGTYTVADPAPDAARAPAYTPECRHTFGDVPCRIEPAPPGIFGAVVG